MLSTGPLLSGFLHNTQMNQEALTAARQTAVTGLPVGSAFPPDKIEPWTTCVVC